MNQRPTPARLGRRLVAQVRPSSMTTFAMALLLAGAVGAKPAAPAGPRDAAAALDRATPAQLKAAYLECDRLASSEMVDSATADHCSSVYEALKARVFGGDFQRLLAWWAVQPRAATPLAARSASGR